MAPRRHRADEHARVGRVLLHAYAVAEQRTAGERRRRVDRQHADPLAAAPQLADQRGRRRRLADARRPGQPDDPGPAGVGGEQGHGLAQLVRAVLDQRDQPGDGARVPGLGALHQLAYVGHVRVSALGHAHDQRVALAAAAAQRGRTDAATAALQLEREVQHEPGAGHADRVAERDRAAVDVDLVVGTPSSRVEAMPTAANASLISTRSRSATVRCPPWRARPGSRWPAAPAARRPGPATTPCAPISASQVRPSSSALALLITTTAAAAVGDLRRRAGGDRAVLGERRPQLAERLGRRVGADALVGRDHDRVALALRDLDRHDLVVEHAVLLAARRRAGASAPRTRPAPRGSARSARCSGRSTHPSPPGRTRRTGRRRPSSRRASTSPYLKPSRDFGSRCGALVIDSMPPATTISNSPARISWSASAIASRPGQADLVDRQRRHGHRDAALDRGLAGGDLARRRPAAPGP